MRPEDYVFNKQIKKEREMFTLGLLNAHKALKPLTWVA